VEERGSWQRISVELFGSEMKEGGPRMGRARTIRGKRRPGTIQRGGSRRSVRITNELFCKYGMRVPGLSGKS
jgi:hypothetical protein